MPTDRFYRLPEEKRKVICDAVRKEFARVPFEKASINQIIRNANISRGSFYTYFTDKEDAVEFVLNDDLTRMRSVCENALDINGGEYLDMLKVLFEYMVQKMQSTGEMMDIIKNVYPHADDKEVFLKKPVETACDAAGGTTDGCQWLMGRMDKGRLRIGTAEELHALILLGINALDISIRHYYQNPDRLGEIRRTFENMLDIIRNGAYRLRTAEG